MNSKRISIASDHAGFDLKKRVVAHLKTAAAVTDLGPADGERVDYPDFAAKVASAITDGAADLGILICGSGIGISIAANKFPGIRAALAHDATTAGLARAHNDAQILCLGARVLTEDTALAAVDAFLETAFEGGRHQRRIDKIHAPEG